MTLHLPLIWRQCKKLKSAKLTSNDTAIILTFLYWNGVIYTYLRSQWAVVSEYVKINPRTLTDIAREGGSKVYDHPVDYDLENSFFWSRLMRSRKLITDHNCFWGINRGNLLGVFSRGKPKMKIFAWSFLVFKSIFHMDRKASLFFRCDCFAVQNLPE